MTGKRPVSGLGRGLSALMDESVRSGSETSSESRGGVREIEIARIRPNPHQPRLMFADEAINELADSIAKRGVLQPILLRPSGGGFEIIAGERRWRAAQRAQLHTIPAIVRNVDDAATAEIALIENIQREDLNAIEEAEGLRQLISQHGHSQDDVGRLVHKSRSHVANLLRLLDLPEIVREMLIHGEISMGHARAVATAPDPESLAKEVIAKGLSVRQTEARARKIKRPPGELVLTERRGDADLEALERQLGDMLGITVKVAHTGAGGTVTLHYNSLDQLDMICQRLSGEPI
ncbi:ParB/RepB/Spo0J family partition protein [Sphingomonas sp.]|uniref:ParB/RepB/Spo0J family partition protein n=1 Tax=Sphingomonas sp. TaxID=28214 RepID=UPI00286D1A65|nr:ParB/RepB/Spo0J family partition protein [Sphingomonas sp.]